MFAAMHFIYYVLFHMPQKVIPQLHFSLNGSPIDYVTEFIFYD